jgi:hypothetical protein
MALFTSCVPQAAETNNGSGGTSMPSEADATSASGESSIQVQSTCTFNITLPTNVSVTNSTVTETSASYQFTQSRSGMFSLEDSVSSEVDNQLRTQNWAKLDTIKGINRYSCEDGSILRVSLKPVGKSLIYLLKLELESV